MKMRVWYEKVKGAITDVVAGTTTVIFEVFDADDKSLKVGSFDMGELSAENQTRIALYGLNKLLTDRTSDDKDKLAKLANMQGVFDFLVTGEWAKERAVGAVIVSPEVEALAIMQEMSIPDTQAALAQYDKDVRKAILGREDVQEAAKVIRDSRKRKDAAVKTLDDLIPTS